ncbi:hypothetical protein Btru_060662 [Bulinus truncatus]|nr:hypothetical protein Btru_060662 [Bulinus truncatus]
MDRVLDLEDREKVLHELKNKIVKTLSIQGTITDEELLQKLEYLKQKNEVLQDAESKYMDKILDLEEMNTGLKSEIQMLKSLSVPNASKDSKLTLESVTSLKAVESESKTLSSKYTETVDLTSPSEQTMTADELSQHLTHLEVQNSRLLGECKEKTSKIQYLESKIVLLHDSEAKLMEKLTEESTGNPDIEELRKKVDHLMEENEFLAQNVESFKKLYKEEKEKCNELQDRVMEESSLFHELEEAQSRLQASESMVEEVQAEYEEQLSEREHQLNHLNHLLSASQLRENELQGEVNALKDYLDTMSDNKSNSQSMQSLREELEQQICELRTHHEHREQDLRRQIELLKLQEEESQGQHRQQVLKLEHYIQDLRHHEYELLKQVDSLQQHENDLLESVDKLRQREKNLQDRVDSLENQLRMRDDESVHTDSGAFSDDQKKRSDPRQQASSLEVYSTKVTLTLARPPPAAGHHVDSKGPSPPAPLHAAPQRAQTRQSPVDKISQEDLAQLVEDLQISETSLKKRIQELERSDLFHKVEQLEAENQNLQRKLRFAESKRTFEVLPSQDKRPRLSHASGDKNNNNSTDHLESSTDIPQRMLDKSEQVLLQRIKDLESLDKHNKTQLSELERDREILHEIARKDKATIHDLHVKIRELQLSERGLKEQINNLEASEGSLYYKCETLEVTRQQLEDRVHELEIHERRLRELVRRLKLNEEHWLSKSGGMENAVAELSANEMQLKRHLLDIEMEKGGLSERAEYLEARVRELENVELSLLQRLKSYEINEATLKNRLGHLENSEAAAHSKAYELDVMNVDLSQRLQKTVEECAMLSQHVSQLQGQIQDLDRRLLSSKDSEMAYKQHVETLEKNENLVQKKVREFELREIDSQARIRELEQTSDILNDKMAALQRSENKLKFRIQELEEIIGKDSEPLDQAQKQKVPQKLEDCQKYIVLLQQQIENLQQQLSTSTKTKEAESVCMSVDEYGMLQKQSALLEETTNQLEEVEREKEHLSCVVLQLRQGKDACGHEVEIEVLKRRLVSYKTLFNKLKFSLSLRQATSLLDSEQDSGPQGDTLPAHLLLESERVLQSVRGSQDGKAEIKDTQKVGPTALGDVVQSTAEVILSQATQLKPEQEESHWKAIEARKPKEMSGSWGGANDIQVGGAKLAPSHHIDGGKRGSTPELEEVTVAFHLQSESELSCHHKTQNDTDSSDGPVPPPRRGRVHRVGKSSSNIYQNNSGHDSSGSATTDADTAAKSTVAANKKHYFGGEKSLPSSAKANQNVQNTKPASLTSFGEDSLYLPSSTQEGVDSLDDCEAPPLPSSAPPLGGGEGEERRDSLDGSTSGMSIRDRIAMIEKQLQTEKTGSKADSDQVFYWKKKSTENLRQVEVLEKDNKHLKEDINRLEKELEEKRRYINLLEIWLSNLDDLLKNKTKQTDREMLEYLQRDLSKLRSELSHIGYRQEDAVLDAAALKTELEHRDKEIMSKRNEIEGLVQKLRQSQEECHNIEQMRRNALDSLRSLEKEVIDLQEAEVQLHNTQTELRTLKKQTEKIQEVYAENLQLRERVHRTDTELVRLRHLCDDYNNLSARYDELDSFKKQAIILLQELQAKVERLSRKCQEKDNLLRRLGADLKRTAYRPSSALEDLSKLEHTMAHEEYNTDFPVTDISPQRPARNKRSSSLDDLDHNYPSSDTDSAFSMPVASSRGKRPTPYVTNRPRSAENFTSSSIARGLHSHNDSQSYQRGEGHQWSDTNLGQFVAIADYDPAVFSQSGRPGLELELREGDAVLITGPMDRTGYYEAEVNGRAGLVPANYLQPLNGSSHMMKYNVDRRVSPIHHDHKSHSVVSINKQVMAKPRDVAVQILKVDSSQNGQVRLQTPDPPQNLHIKGIVSDRGLLLSWLPPKVDDRGNNKGFQLLGYMVYVNNQAYEQISNPNICEFVLEDLNLDGSLHIAIQSLCANGHVSPKAELVFEGVVRAMKSKDSTAQVKEDINTDLSSVLSSAHYKRGHRKAVMALYDYNPKQQSPHDYTAFELAFQAGDVIYVYGDPRPDGFFHGEVDGKRGLAPACFVEDLSKIEKAGRKTDQEATQVI